MAGTSAILYDATHLFTLHIYCFFIYAKRVYEIFNTAIYDLFLLFNGKKFNPLRNRKDTCTAPTEELLLLRTLLGTLVFVVLIALYPTVFVYYFACKILNLLVEIT